MISLDNRLEFNFNIRFIGHWVRPLRQLMVMYLLRLLKMLFSILFVFILKGFCLVFISVEFIHFQK